MRSLARALKVSVWTSGLLVLLNAGWLLVSMRWAHTGSFTSAELSRVELGLVVLTFAVVGSMVCAGVLFVLWTRRARANAPGREAVHRYSLAATIWGWLPVVSLWIPYRIMADIWRASAPNDHLRLDLRQVDFWWLAWIISGIVQVIADRKLSFPLNADVLTSAAWWATPAAILLLISAALLTSVVSSITTWQSKHTATAHTQPPATA